MHVIAVVRVANDVVLSGISDAHFDVGLACRRALGRVIYKLQTREPDVLELHFLCQVDDIYLCILRTKVEGDVPTAHTRGRMVLVDGQPSLCCLVANGYIDHLSAYIVNRIGVAV